MPYVQPKWLPGRPPNEKDLLTCLNGDPQFLGILTSSGTTAPVNNVSTATPFKRGRLLDSLLGTRAADADSLSGRVLLISATAAGVFLTSDTPLINTPSVTTVALRSVIPPAANTMPGDLMNADETKILIMLPGNGWLQWLSNSGSASLIVKELV